MRLPPTIRTAAGLTVRGAGPDLLAELLAEVEAVSLRQGVNLAETMADGITRAQLEAIWAPRGLEVPDEAAVWWGWHDGPRPEHDGYAGFSQLSAAISAASWDLKSKGTSEFTWNRFWVPVWGPGPHHVAIDTRCTGGLTVRATEFDMNTQEPAETPGVVSLCTPIVWWLTARAEGWVSDAPQVPEWRTHLIPRDWLATELARL